MCSCVRTFMSYTRAQPGRLSVSPPWGAHVPQAGVGQAVAPFAPQAVVPFASQAAVPLAFAQAVEPFAFAVSCSKIVSVKNLGSSQYYSVMMYVCFLLVRIICGFLITYAFVFGMNVDH